MCITVTAVDTKGAKPPTLGWFAPEFKLFPVLVATEITIVQGVGEPAPVNLHQVTVTAYGNKPHWRKFGV
jgi:hypothetical protein